VAIKYPGHLKVADFGAAQFSGSNRHVVGARGTPLYMAPEMLRNVSYGSAVDWWALGCIAFEMATGTPLFDSNTQVMAMAGSRKLPEPVRRAISQTGDAKAGSHAVGSTSMQLNSLISGLLTIEEWSRLGSKEGARAVKQHFFFDGMDFEALLRGEVVAPYCPLGVTEESSCASASDEFASFSFFESLSVNDLPVPMQHGQFTSSSLPQPLQHQHAMPLCPLSRLQARTQD